MQARLEIYARGRHLGDPTGLYPNRCANSSSVGSSNASSGSRNRSRRQFTRESVATTFEHARNSETAAVPSDLSSCTWREGL